MPCPYLNIETKTCILTDYSLSEDKVARYCQTRRMCFFTSNPCTLKSQSDSSPEKMVDIAYTEIANALNSQPPGFLNNQFIPFGRDISENGITTATSLQGIARMLATEYFRQNIAMQKEINTEFHDLFLHILTKKILEGFASKAEQTQKRLGKRRGVPQGGLLSGVLGTPSRGIGPEKKILVISVYDFETHFILVNEDYANTEANLPQIEELASTLIPFISKDKVLQLLEIGDADYVIVLENNGCLSVYVYGHRRELMEDDIALFDFSYDMNGMSNRLEEGVTRRGDGLLMHLQNVRDELSRQ